MQEKFIGGPYPGGEGYESHHGLPKGWTYG